MKIALAALSIGLLLPCHGRASEAIDKNDVLANVDWQAVEPATSVEATELLISIGRALDVHYRGGMPSIELRYDNGYISDGEKIHLAGTAAVWKRLVMIVDKHIQNSGGQEYLPNRTAPSWYHESDGFGDVDRYVYHVFIVRPGKLRFDTISKLESYNPN